MKTLNKSLLAAATVSALALSGAASAATLVHVAGTQITSARDLYPSATTILSQVGNTLQLRANTAEAAALAAAALAGDTVRVRMNFDFVPGSPGIYMTPDAPTLVQGFVLGTQGAPTIDTVANHDTAGLLSTSSEGYSNPNGSGAQGLEFRIDYVAGTVAPGTGPVPYFLEFDGLALTNLVNSLGDVNGTINASIEVFNVTSNTTIITATSGVVARSVWGLNDASPDITPSLKRIDVGSLPLRRTRFSPLGGIGGSNPASAATNVFDAGQVSIDITQVGSANVRHLATPTTSYNVIAPSTTYQVTVLGDDLSPWSWTGGIWLGTVGNACVLPDANRILLTVDSSDTTRASTALIPQTHVFFASLSNSAPTAANFQVCFSANSSSEMTPQLNLRGFTRVRYNDPILRRSDNPDIPFVLDQILMNGSVMTFQNFNPASNNRAVSFLRLTNNNATDCPVFIDAKDDLGRHAGPIEVLLSGHQSQTFNSKILEDGIDSGDTRILSGKFSDGAGRWYLRVLAECTNIQGSSLNRNENSGTVTNLTTERSTTGSTVFWQTPPTKVPGSLP